MPNGGTLSISTTTLSPHAETNPGDVVITVTDTGVGIPRSQLEKIFEPFYTTRADSGGTGLGLGLCRMLISEMGGRISAQSVLNEGTTFTVILHRSEHTAKQHAS
jgi:signal transduction histidine kinase